MCPSEQPLAVASTSRTRVALATVVFAVLFAQVLLYPGVDTLVTAMGAETRLDASTWFLAAEFAAFVLFAGPWGALSDTAGRRAPLIAIAAIGGTGGYLALALLPGVLSLSFPAVLALRALQGATTVGAFSLALAMLADLSGGHGHNMGAAGIAIGLGTALGAPIGGQLYTLSPFAPLYGAAGLLIVAGVMALAVTDRPPADDRQGFVAMLSGVKRTPLLALPFTFGLIDRFTAGFFALVGTLYFRETFDLDPAATGIMLGLFFAPFALLQYPFGRLSDRIGRTAPIIAGSAFYGIGVILVGAAPTVELAGVAMVLIGVLGALMAPATLALVADLAPVAERGVAMGGFNAVGSVGFLLGIVGGGVVAGASGYVAAFVFAGVLETLLAAVALPVFWRAELDRTAVFG
jgi:MFS family permease